MAAEDLNNGGKLNRRVELVFEDTWRRSEERSDCHAEDDKC